MNLPECEGCPRRKHCPFSCYTNEHKQKVCSTIVDKQKKAAVCHMSFMQPSLRVPEQIDLWRQRLCKFLSLNLQ